MSTADIFAILQGAVTTASLSGVAILLGLPLGLLLAPAAS
jgi:ABC-type amino acid transport system permease subunit